MTPLLQWANRWGIPPAALSDLMATLGAGHATIPPPPGSSGSEASVQAAVRLEAARRGIRLWRNNTGAAQDETGRVIRYGLANDSPAVSKVCKSSDLIGITPVTCPCGHKYGVFTAVECKAPGWKFRESDQRATAQLAFIKLVVSMGGIGRFITRVEDL